MHLLLILFSIIKRKG